MQKKWTYEKIKELFDQPFLDLIFQAQKVHREFFTPNTIQACSLLSVKTGACPEDCSYCPQSLHNNTNLKPEPLMKLDAVLEKARKAKALGSTRFCMGAAWRGPTDRLVKHICEMVKHIKPLGLETCATLGLLTKEQAVMLKEAGLDFYNHNIDCSPEFYGKIITTRTFQDRLETLDHVRKAGIKVCCGGILGMGETNEDRIKMISILADFDTPPESVPINQLIPIPGTPLQNAHPVSIFDFIRTAAITRITMPQSYVRLAAGRENMSPEFQTLCFMAGVNSIFFGEKLLTASNATPQEDHELLTELGVKLEIMPA